MRLFFGLTFLFAPIYVPALVDLSCPLATMATQVVIDFIRYILTVASFLVGMAIIDSAQR